MMGPQRQTERAREFQCKEGDKVLYRNRVVAVKEVLSQGELPYPAYRKKNKKDKWYTVPAFLGEKAFITCCAIHHSGKVLTRTHLAVFDNWSPLPEGENK